ncbi:hypothetical protein LEMLEM_LOCUS6514, partial [Lemmus lemmus]
HTTHFIAKGRSLTSTWISALLPKVALS